ncbi:MAG: signal peptidase II, partial [Deltaproteobacteria bacterium]|nr:signal peptidase II [Deltaproteobacteria bacterium]
HSIHIVSGFFDITHIRNRGTAFGMFRDGSVFLFLFLIAVSIAALAVIFLIYRKVENNQWYRLALSLIVGGAVGNLIYRIRLGEVIDFLDVYIGQYHWPAFNVADSAITIGVFLAVLSFKEGKGS